MGVCPSWSEAQRLPLSFEQPVDPGIRNFVIHDAVLSQRAFVDKSELLQHAARCAVARIGLGLDTVQVQRVESPSQHGVCRFGREALAPCRIVETIAQLCAGMGRIPWGRAPPADENTIRDTLDSEPRAGAFLF